MTRVAISFDYDSPAGLRNSFNSRHIPADSDQRGAEHVLEVLDRHNVRATFGVVGNAARSGPSPEHCRAQVRQISDCGHEIASHSMWHRFLPALDDEQLFLELAESKAVLEDCTGKEVTGFIPPFNRPMHFPVKGSFSMSEKLGVFGRGLSRQTIPTLLAALHRTGYLWSRVSFENKFRGLAAAIPGFASVMAEDTPRQPFLYNRVTAIPLHASGFLEPTRKFIRTCLQAGVPCVTIYAHTNMSVFLGEEHWSSLDGLLESFKPERAYGRIEFCTMAEAATASRSVTRTSEDMAYELRVPELSPMRTEVMAASASSGSGYIPAGQPVAAASYSPRSETMTDTTTESLRMRQALSASISIVVPCRNEKKGIADLLESILAQNLIGMDWEVIIADGMSDDGTRELIRPFLEREPRIHIIDNPGRIVSTGLNLALSQARGEIILRMDAHTEYASDYVRTCVDTLLRTGAHNTGGPARTKAKGFIPKAIAAAYQNPFACGAARFHDADYEGFVDTVPYGCWRKSTLVELGGFDEALVRNQDDELNLRLIRSGGRIWQTPAIISWYRPRDRFVTLARQYFQYGFWKVAVILKHRMPASWRHLVPVTFVLANLTLLLNCLVSGAAGWDALFTAGNFLWAAMMGLYLALGVTASLRNVAVLGWKCIIVMPVIFATYHFSYGFGFLGGLLYWPFVRNRISASPSKLFTGLTR